MKRIGAIDPSKIIYVDSIVPASKRPLLADTAIEIREISDLTMRRTRTPTNVTENAPKLVAVDKSLSIAQSRPTPVTNIDETRSQVIEETRPVMVVEQEAKDSKLQGFSKELSQPSNHNQVSNTLNSGNQGSNVDTLHPTDIRVEEQMGNYDYLGEGDSDDIVSVISATYLEDDDQMTNSETETGDSS